MPESVMYFKPITVFLASMFGGPLAGTFMVTVNAKNLGQATNRNLLWLFGIALYLFETRTRHLNLYDGPLRGRWFAIHQLLVPMIFWSFAYFGQAKRTFEGGEKAFSLGRAFLITVIGLFTLTIPTILGIVLTI